MADLNSYVQCPKCSQWFDSPAAHHDHYEPHYKKKKGQTILDRFTCGDPGPVVATSKGIRVHGRRPNAD